MLSIKEDKNCLILTQLCDGQITEIKIELLDDPNKIITDTDYNFKIVNDALHVFDTITRRFYIFSLYPVFVITNIILDDMPSDDAVVLEKYDISGSKYLAKADGIPSTGEIACKLNK